MKIGGIDVGWKTIAGTVLLSAAKFITDIGFHVPAEMIAVMQALGGILGGIGIRQAIAKLKQ